MTVNPLKNDDVGQLAYALAHEVRNPLATINLAVQILKSQVGVHDPKLYLDIIYPDRRPDLA